MNLLEILKDVPKGTKLYSPLFGEVLLQETDDDVWVITSDNKHRPFYSDGRYYDYKDSECLLFPSKDNHDWTTFNAPKSKHEFKPFELVLVRQFDHEEWCTSHFSHIDSENIIRCENGIRWIQCIPYKGNEHLLGTTDLPDTTKATVSNEERLLRLFKEKLDKYDPENLEKKLNEIESLMIKQL